MFIGLEFNLWQFSFLPSFIIKELWCFFLFPQPEVFWSCLLLLRWIQKDIITEFPPIQSPIRNYFRLGLCNEVEWTILLMLTCWKSHWKFMFNKMFNKIHVSILCLLFSDYSKTTVWKFSLYAFACKHPILIPFSVVVQARTASSLNPFYFWNFTKEVVRSLLWF